MKMRGFAIEAGVAIMLTCSVTAQTSSLPTAPQVIVGWQSTVNNYMDRLRGKDVADCQVAAMGLSAEKSAALQQIIYASQTPAAASNYVNQFLVKVTAGAPEALSSLDFRITMFDITASAEVPLVNSDTKNLMVRTRPDLAAFLLASATSDDEASALIAKYGVMDTLTQKLVANPTWVKSIKAACFHTNTVNHLTWRRLMPILDDNLRRSLVTFRPNDTWLLLVAYGTAKTTAFKKELAPRLKSFGVDPDALFSNQSMLLDATGTQKTITQQAKDGRNYWKRRFDDDDDDAQHAISDAFNQMRASAPVFSQSMTAFNQTQTQIQDTTANMQNAKTPEQLAWRFRNITGLGTQITTADVARLADEPEKRQMIIEQGDANAQLALIRACATSTGNRLQPAELELLTFVARDNRIPEEIARIPNLQPKTRIALIKNTREDTSNTQVIYQRIIAAAPVNAAEARALVNAGATPDVLKKILDAVPTADVIAELALCDWLDIARKCVQMQPNDKITLQNAMTKWKLFALRNDIDTRNTVVRSPHYPAIYQHLEIETAETLANQTQILGTKMTAQGNDQQPTWANMGTSLNPKIVYFDGPGTSSSYQTLLLTCSTTYSNAITAEMKAQLNPNSLTNLVGAFWPKPAGASNPLAQIAAKNNVDSSDTTSSQTQLRSQVAQQTTTANTTLGTMIYYQKVTLPDGSVTNIAQTIRTSSTSFSDLQKAAMGTPTAGNTSKPTAADQAQLQQANNKLLEALDDAYKTTVQATETDRLNQQARQLATTTALQSGNLSSLGLQALIDRLEQTKLQAAQEKAAWFDRTDLSYVTPKHPYYSKANQATVGSAEVITRINSNQEIKVLRVGNDEIPEYINTETVVFEDKNQGPTDGNHWTTKYTSGQSQNPKWMAALASQDGHPWRYTVFNGNTKTNYIDYYQYLNDAWQAKYYGTNGNTIPAIESLIAQRENTITTAELTRALEEVNLKANQERQRIQALTPTKFYEGSAEYKQLPKDLLQSAYIRRDVISNRTVKYFDRFQYEADRWNDKYLGNRPGTPDYYRTLLQRRSSYRSNPSTNLNTGAHWRERMHSRASSRDQMCVPSLWVTG